MTRILLVCSAGMSTSMLVKKMLAAAEEAGVPCQIRSSSEAESRRYLGDVDVVLLGPQVRFLQGRIKKAAGAVPRPPAVDVIDPASYGRMDGGGVLRHAVRLAEGGMG